MTKIYPEIAEAIWLYEKLYLISVMGYGVICALSGLCGLEQSGLLLALLLTPFTILSIIAAMQYRKLPDANKNKPHYIAADLLSVHPYITTVVLVGINALFFLYALV